MRHADRTPEYRAWDSMKQQRNRNNNIIITYRGKARLLVEVCEETGIAYGTANIKTKIWL